MCGILGICLDKRNRSDASISDIKSDFANLLVASQVRGTDASGVYIVNRNTDIVYLKAPVAAEDMVFGRANASAFWELLDAHVGADTVAIIGHTRAATTGSPECNDNNHPVVDAPIIGVHNGVIRNHLALNERYPKIAEVDSAAIFSMLKAKAGSKPLATGTIAKAFPELQGPAAIAVADTRKPDGVFLARNTNPINFARYREEGVLMFASTADILKDALGEDTATFPMPENTVCRVSSKTISTKLTFVPMARAKATGAVKGKGGFDNGVAFADGGERCPTCRQLFLVVYMGTQEIKVCNCNPYGSQVGGPKATATKKTAAKRPTSAKKGGSGRPLITWVIDSESTTIAMSGALGFHHYGPRGHFFDNGCTVEIVQQCGHPNLGGTEPFCPSKEKPCDCAADSSKFQFLGNGRTRHHHITKTIDDGKARKGQRQGKRLTSAKRSR